MDDDDIDIEGDEEVSRTSSLLDTVFSKQNDIQPSIIPAPTVSPHVGNDTVNIFGDPSDFGSSGREALLDMYPEPEWLLDQSMNGSSSAVADMDEQSRLLIQNMLAEEEMYFGQGTLTFRTIDAANPSVSKPTIENVTKSNKRPRDDQKEKKKVKKLRTESNPQHVATHNTRWSEDEDALLKEGVKKYGYGSWTRIADYIGTRSALQVKNRGRHLAATGALPMVRAENKAVVKEEVEVPLAIPVPAVATSQQQSNNTVDDAKKDDAEEEEDIEIDITDDEEEQSPILPQPVVDTAEESDSDVESIAGTADIEDRQSGSIAVEDAELTDPEIKPVTPTTAEEDDGRGRDALQETHVEEAVLLSEALVEPERSDVTVDIPNPLPPTPAMQEPPSKPETSVSEVNAAECPVEDSPTLNTPPSPTSSTINIPSSPQEHIQIDINQIHTHEITHNPEWFHSISSAPTAKLNKKLANKTPDRYMKIRNYIILQWEKCRPKYLTKTAVRPGLRGEGDVNAIGRVHDYLESIGAINEGHGEKKVKKAVVDMAEGGDGGGEEVWITFDSSGRRKRRIRNGLGEWVDENGADATRPVDFNDVEIDAEIIEERNARREERRLMALNSKYFADEEIEKVDKSILRRKRANAHNHEHSHGAGDVLGSYDPFRLIPVRRYSPDFSAPFRVEVKSNALIIMDFHSHLAQTEIIGLLGGTYKSDQQVLSIESVFPCNSLSTGVQCEMDPESEMKARDVFAEQGLEVVGWYHSHPTFEPNPSIRDIENEVAYQNLFQRPDGSEPFVGAIISPYDPRNPLDVSRIKFLHVSEQWNSAAEYRIPYACEKTIVASESLPGFLFNQIAELVGEYRFHEHRVELMKPYRRGDAGQTRLDKLLASIGSHAMMVGSEASAGFLARLRELVEKGFGSTK